MAGCTGSELQDRFTNWGTPISRQLGGLDGKDVRGQARSPQARQRDQSSGNQCHRLREAVVALGHQLSTPHRLGMTPTNAGQVTAAYGLRLLRVVDDLRQSLSELKLPCGPSEAIDVSRCANTYLDLNADCMLRPCMTGSRGFCTVSRSASCPLFRVSHTGSLPLSPGEPLLDRWRL
jgi:hypothetical protein